MAVTAEREENSLTFLISMMAMNKSPSLSWYLQCISCNKLGCSIRMLEYTQTPDEVGRSMHQWNKTDFLNCGIYVMTSIWNLKQPVLSGCFSWMTPNLYINNGWVPSKNLYIIEWNDHSKMKNRHIRHPSNEPENYESLTFRGIYSPNPNPPNSKKSMLHLFTSTLNIRCEKTSLHKNPSMFGTKKTSKILTDSTRCFPIVSHRYASLEVLAIRLKPPLRPSSFFFFRTQNPNFGGFQPRLKHIPSFQVRNQKSLKPPPKRSDSVVLLQDLSWRSWTFFWCLFGWSLESTRMRPTLNVDPFKTSPLETLICVVSTKKSGYHHIHDKQNWYKQSGTFWVH